MPDHTQSVEPPVLDLEIQEDTSAHESDLSTPAALYAACRRRVSGFLDDQIEKLFSHANDDLFAQARDALSDDHQRGCFDAMQELHRVKLPIRSGFTQAVLDGLDRLWSAEVASDPAVPATDLDYESMSLVDTQSMDDGVLVSKIAARASADLRAGEHALEVRLSQVLPCPVDADSNPLSARNVCAAFHDSVQNLGAERASRQALFRALESTVVKVLGGLHQELNDLLVSQGISPRIRYGRPTQPEQHTQRVSTATADIQGRPQALPSLREPAPSPTSAGAPPPASTAAASPASAWISAGDSALEIPFADASATVRQLVDLERTLRPGGAAPESAAQADERLAIDAALARLQQSGETAAWGEKGPYALGARVRAALAEQGIELDGAAITDVLDLVSTLLDNLLADPLVQSGAKPLIRRMGLPLTRAALSDVDFFASDSHPGRSTINHLGRLAVPAQGSDAGTPFSAADAEAVVNEVLAAPRPDRQAFSRAAAELDALLQRQSAQYQQRVSRLLEDLERQQQALAGKRHGASAGEPPLSAVESAHESWPRALHTVARLQTNDVLILRADSLSPQPASLVWRGRDGGVLVFADALGRQAASFARRELAMALRRGAARLDEAALMPVVDRAMCGVLQGLHGRLEHKASRDPLTGLANRKRFEADLARTMKSPPSAQRSHHVCVLGLAHLPDIAERFGERAAETLVRRYAPMLERQIGQKGMVAHLGQGQFGVLLPDTTRAEVLQLVERHRRSLELSTCAYKGETVDLAASIGVVAIASEASNVGLVLEAASEAYDKSRSGSSMGLHVQETPAGWARGAAGASEAPSVHELMATQRLVLRCQRVAPVIRQSGLLPYYEILLGVREPDGRIQPPGGVILAAEQAGEIAALDRWVVAEALRWMAANDARLPPLKGFAINLSGGTLSDPRLARFVTEEIQSAGVRPERIMFEVTESAAIERLSVAREFMDCIRALGCQFALDDFGAGHASFSYLKLLPVDTVKIDGMFVKELTTNPADEAMVRSIHDIAALMGKRTVAEFVENEATLHRLHAIGVDYAQGYGIEKPMPIAELLT